MTTTRPSPIHSQQPVTHSASILVAFQLFLVLLFGFVDDSKSEENSEIAAKQMLMAMMQAMKILSYQGTIVYWRDNQVQTMRVYHSFNDGHKHERVIALNSPMREIIRDAEKVTCYLPDSKKVFVEHQPTRRSFLVNIPEDLRKHAKYYKFALLEREFIIHRETRVISIQPRDEYRYARKIWVDTASKLPLKFELINETDNIVEQIIFTSLVIDDSIPVEEFSPTTDAESFSWEIRSGEEIPIKNQDWRFNVLPAGFNQVFYAQRILPGTHKPTQHILLSDGFSSVSVYLEKTGGERLKSRKKNLGATNLYSLESNEYKITVIGEVPMKTVREIGDAIIYLDSH